MNEFEAKKIELKNKMLMEENKKLREQIAEKSNHILSISAELVQCQLSLRMKTVTIHALENVLSEQQRRIES